MTLSQRFVAPISRFCFEALPEAVVEKTKVCIIHALACTLAGLDERWSMAAREMTAALQPEGGSSIWFTGARSNMADAAFVNAVAAQSILHEDIHRDSNAHPGIIVVPAALAAGEARRCDGKRLLAAVAAGYEMMGADREGDGLSEFAGRGFRPTSIIGIFGSAMAAGLLLGLREEEHVAALGLAGNFASGINEWALAGTDDLYFQNGMASRNGVVAAELARRGILAPGTILEGRSGFCNAYDFSRTNLEAVDCGDGRYVIMDVLFKPAPACALVQTTAQAALDAAARGVRPGDVASGRIITFTLGKRYAGCDNGGPFENLLQARMSNQFNFAATLARGGIGNDNYLCFEDAEIVDLASRMTVVIDPGFDGVFPGKQPVRVELTLKNGETVELYREEPEYLERDGIVGKFVDGCAAAFGKDRAERAVELLLRLENVGDVFEIGEALRR